MEQGAGYEEEQERGKDKEEQVEENSKAKGEVEGEERLNIRDTDNEVRSPFEPEGRDRRVEMQKTKEEKEPEKLSESPAEETSIAPQPEQQPSPAEENTFEVEPSEEDKAVVEEPKVPSPPVRQLSRR